MAICRTHNSTHVLDLARSWKSPHDPGQVVEEMAAICKEYRVYQVRGDRYAGAWPESEFRKHNIRYEPSPKDKSSIYIDLIPLILSRTVELLDNRQLVSELRSLERRTRTAGRDLIDHPIRGHDDLANAVAGALVVGGSGERLAGPVI